MVSQYMDASMGGAERSCGFDWLGRTTFRKTAASNFVDCVHDYGGCPVKLRTDCGTENVIMATMQCEFRQDVDAHIYGPSPVNQRIEGWWSFYR